MQIQQVFLCKVGIVFFVVPDGRLCEIAHFSYCLRKVVAKLKVQKDVADSLILITLSCRVVASVLSVESPSPACYVRVILSDCSAVGQIGAPTECLTACTLAHVGMVELREDGSAAMPCAYLRLDG